MSQIPLLEESLESAMASDIQAIGGTKVFGAVLFPEMSVVDAGKKVSRLINPRSDERFNYQQILLLIRKAKEVGSYATLYYIVDDTGFNRPAPVEPDDERAALQRQAIEAVSQLKHLVSRLERVSAVGATK